MTTETMEIRQLARQFAESELRPHAEKWDHDGAIAGATFAQLAELGFCGLLVPEAYGGMEFDLSTFTAVIEELAWGEPAVALSVANTSLVAQLIVRSGTENQKRQWLERLARGEVMACVAVSEETGTAVAELATTATRTGEAWVLRGTKKWVTNASRAGLALVVARADLRPAAFLVPTDAPGYAPQARTATMGLRPLEIAAVALDDVRVDDESLLAVPAPDALLTDPVALLATAAVAVGIAQAAYEHARGYANVREQFGQKLRSFEGIQFKLADMVMRIEAARLLLQKAAADDALGTSAMAKVFASETAMWVTTQAVQIYGGYGYMRDYPVEKLMRDAKATEILDGSNEQLRSLIARELYQ